MAAWINQNKDWELEAIQEQFKVFRSLTEPCYNVKAIHPSNKTKHICSYLEKIALEHYCFNDENPSVMKAFHSITNAEENVWIDKIYFVVIVTNLKGNTNKLYKVPVFFVNYYVRSVFVDLNGNVFGSWNEFMQKNRLPACKFCFPVNGFYRFGGKLRVDFASSSGAALLPKKISNVGIFGKLMDAMTVATSCLLKVAPVCNNLFKELKEVASKFLTDIAPNLKDICTLFYEIYKFKNGQTSILGLMSTAYRILPTLAEQILKAISKSWNGVKRSLSKSYIALEGIYKKHLLTGTEKDQSQLLATASKINSKIIEIDSELQNKLNCCIFDNCKNECALQNSYNKQPGLDGNDQPFTKFTTDILDSSKTDAKNNEAKNLNEIIKLLKTQAPVILDEYKHGMESYLSFVEAAKDASESDFDLSKFNSSLGIKENNPRYHYMLKALESVKTIRLQYKVNEKSNRIKSNEQVELIPIWDGKTSDSIEGAYRCIGIHGAGKLSASDVRKAFHEHLSIEVNNPVSCCEKENLMTIYHDKFFIMGYQQVDEGNTSEALIFLSKNGITK